MELFHRKEGEFHFFLRSVIGYRPKDISIFRQAFVHKSTNRANTGGAANNERLEFLGDALLSAIAAEELYVHFPTADEGKLSRLRSNLVCRQRLNQVARELGLCQYISYHTPQRLEQTHIPGDVVEALIAAIYIDGGASRAAEFVRQKIVNAAQMDETAMPANDTNFKSTLIEWGQKYRKTVHFDTCEHGEGDSAFRSKVSVDGQLLSEGYGRNKKQAEQQAAEQASICLKIAQK